MKAKTLFDAIGVIAAGAAIAQRACDMLGPYARRLHLSDMLPRAISTFPNRISNGVAAFIAAPEQPAPRKPGGRRASISAIPSAAATTKPRRVPRAPALQPERV